MKEKINFLKEDRELANKILLLYQTIFNFEKNKKSHSVGINSKRKDGETTSTIFEDKRSI
jgi:hypothetical protein